jgi:selenophosphate synthase
MPASDAFEAPPLIISVRIVVGKLSGKETMFNPSSGTPPMAYISLTAFATAIPPSVDEPSTYGEIAVANAVSDIYAMGGVPLLGLNIVSFPDNLPTTILTEIINGGASKASEAGILVVGGHTIKNDVPLYGMAVTAL